MKKQKNSTNHTKKAAKQNSPNKVNPAASVTLSSSECVQTNYADHFFQTIFSEEDSIRDFLSFIGELNPLEHLDFKLVKPVLIGNRENDLSFFLNHVLYYFIEHQSTLNGNMPLRLLFYIAKALEQLIDGKKLFRNKQIKIPEVKCYTIFTGIKKQTVSSNSSKITDIEKFEETEAKKVPAADTSDSIEYEQHLSESYLTVNGTRFDLELIVHCFDFMMTEKEIQDFIDSNLIPVRFKTINNIVIQYALFINASKYEISKQSSGIQTRKAKQALLEICELFLSRGYMVQFFQRKEVINMAIEQITREEIIWDNGFDDGYNDGYDTGYDSGYGTGYDNGLGMGANSKLKSLVKKKLKKGKSLAEITDELEDTEANIQRVILELEAEK